MQNKRPKGKQEPALAGDLIHQPFSDMLQFLNLSRRTGFLSVRVRNKEAFLQIIDGNIVWAEFPPLYGEEAVFALMALGEGSFKFFAESTPLRVDRNIHRPGDAVIFEGVRLLDENGPEILLRPFMLDLPSIHQVDKTPLVPMKMRALIPPEDENPTWSAEDTASLVENIEEIHPVAEEHDPAEPKAESELGEWWSDLTGLIQKISVSREGSFPLRYLTKEQLRDVLQKGADSRAACLVAAYETLEAFMAPCTWDFSLDRIFEGKLPVLRFSCPPRKVLYLVGIPKNVDSRLIEDFPALFWVDPGETREVLIDAQKRGHRAVVCLVPDREEALRPKLAKDDRFTMPWRCVFARAGSWSAVSAGLMGTLGALENIYRGV